MLPQLYLPPMREYRLFFNLKNIFASESVSDECIRRCKRLIIRAFAAFEMYPKHRIKKYKIYFV